MSASAVACHVNRPLLARRKFPHATLIAVALLALHYLLAVGGKLQESTTSDELVHLTGGLSYWQNHDYRLQPENGVLPQRWAALPAWLTGAKFPALAGNDSWRTSDVWVVGHQFFYETGEDHFPRLMAGRAMIALFSVATGLLVFCWSRRLFGDTGALVSLGFFVFCTDFLEHGALVTSDACMAFFFLASVGAWWRHLHDGRWSSWWLSAITLGLAFVAKYSAVLLLPMIAVMILVRAFAAEPLQLAGRTFDTRTAKLGAATVSALGHGAVTVLIIWAFYGFRYTAFNPALPPADHFIRPWTFMEARIGAAGPIIHALRTVHALPEAFLYGFAYVIQTVAIRSAFLNGDYSVTGWPTYFLWTFALKTTLPLMLACVLAGGLALRRWWRGTLWRSELYRLLPLVALFTIYWATSLTSHLNIGHRHILPTYPVIFIAVGGLGAWTVRWRSARGVLVGLLLGWHAVEATLVAPHYLAYFNEIVGGPKNGWQHLVDSSLDWGQDLPGLKQWLDQHRDGQPVFLSYFGTGEPTYYHIDARRLPFTNNFFTPAAYVKLEPGTYCIGATMLQHVYSTVPGAKWTPALEQEFQDLRLLEPLFERYTLFPKERAELERETPRAKWLLGIRRFDVLRFARLCCYLRLRGPDENIGYSILVFHLNASEVTASTAGSIMEWEQLLEKAARAHLE